MSGTPTAAQLRAAIDEGATGDKIDFPDHAAAPLGTDDEAAGHPPSRLERTMAAEALPSSTRRPRKRMVVLAYAVLNALVIAGIVVVIVMTLSQPT